MSPECHEKIPDPLRLLQRTTLQLDSYGEKVDSTGQYRNDGKKMSLRFSYYHAQRGFVPLDRHAAKALSAFGIDPGKDTILFSGCLTLCVERHSEPRYMKPSRRHPLSLDHTRDYRSYPILDTLKMISYRPGCYFDEGRLRRDYPKSVIDLLASTSFTRKVLYRRGRRLILTEYRIPYRDHCISVIRGYRLWNGQLEDLHTWKGGNRFEDPTAPDNLFTGFYHTISMRDTREIALWLMLKSEGSALSRPTQTD